MLLIAAVVLFAYPFVIYPAVLRFLVRRPPEPDRDCDAPEFPTVALVICALNEGKIIRQKIENSLDLNYPADKLRIILVSDGSTDDTAQIAREYEDRGIIVLERAKRRGKIANLNQVLPSRDEEILALSDANVLYHADAIRQIVSRFRDPDVGCVSGKVILTDTTPQLDGPTTQYYSLEWRLQEQASRLYSMVGADGAMYALRRELFQPCPDDTLIEDLMIPMQVVKQGKRVVFEPRALGWERGVSTLGEEFRRKVRIAAGAAQGLLRGHLWPSGTPAKFWFIFVSHKLLRWLSPLVGLVALAAALTRAHEPLSKAVAVGTVCLTVLALLRLITGSKRVVFSAPFYFLFGQVTLAIGLYKGLAGQQTVLWSKVDR